MNGAGQYEETLRLIQTALENSIRPDDFKNRSWLFKLRGNASFRLGNYDEALAAYQQSLETAQKSGERTIEADAENGMALVYQFTGDYQKAIAAFNHLAELYRSLGDKDGHGIVLANLGDTYQLMGEYDRAMSFYEQALPLLRESHDRRNEAATIDAMAATKGNQGLYDESFKLNQMALQIYRETGDRGGESNVLGNIGENHLERGNYWEGLKYLTEALAISTALKEKYKQQIQLGAIGNAYYFLGDYDRAAEALRRSQHLAHEIGDVSSEAIRIGDLGAVQRAWGKNDSAMQSFQQALAICDTLDDKRGQATYSADIGVMHTLAKNYKQAFPYFDRALKLNQEIGNKLGEGETTNYLGELYLQTRDYARAKQAHQTALTIGNSLHAAKVIWEARYGLAQVAAHEGKFAEAKTWYEQAITGIEATRARLPLAEHKAYFLAGRDQIYKSLIHLLGQKYRQQPQAGFAAEAFLYTEKAKARALLDLLAEANVQLRSKLPARFQQRQEAYEQKVAALQTRLQDAALAENTRQALHAELDEAEKAQQDLIVEIRRSNPAYAQLNYPEAVTLSAVRRNNLAEGELMLAYALGEEGSYLWAITKQQNSFAPLPPAAEITPAVEGYVALLKDSKNIGISHRERGQQLFDLVMKPAASLVQKARKIIVIADGALQNLPFEALMLPEPKGESKYLIQQAEIVYAPSATVLALLQANVRAPVPRAKAALLAFADPVFGKEGANAAPLSKRGNADSLAEDFSLRGWYAERGKALQRLPYTAMEADSIAQFFPANLKTIYRRQEATEENFKRENLPRYAFVHFATHGLLDQQHPSRSSLVLTLDSDPAEDGFVQISEIFNLRLAADLVVLSACESAGGKRLPGEGLLGMTRAFMYAGAPAVLGSLWSVNDRATAKLMARFYRYLHAGKNIGAALQQAKIDMIQDQVPSHRHPYYWAAFILMGRD